MLRILVAFLALFSGPIQALTVEDIIAHHGAQSFGYRVQSFPVDGALREEFGLALRGRPPEVQEGVMAALEGRFDGATIHVFRHDITTLDTSITALEVEGEVVLLSFNIILFFERSDVAEAQIALFQALLSDWAPQRFRPGFAEAALGVTIERAQAYLDGNRSGPYPGWYYQETGAFVAMGFTNIPDYVNLTVTTLTDCPPRYPMDGWALLFLCEGG